jgi:hypothetical protein
LFFGYGDVRDSLLDVDGLDVAILLRVSEGFVDVVEGDVLALVILLDRLQTGDVA